MKKPEFSKERLSKLWEELKKKGDEVLNKEGDEIVKRKQTGEEAANKQARSNQKEIDYDMVCSILNSAMIKMEFV